MAKQTINIGSTANDGTGDSIRAGGTKINANFTELYDADTALASDIAGKQSSSTVVELIRDTIGAALVSDTGVTITVNDGADTITIATTITQYTDEMARDALGTALTPGANITITPNDGSDTITISSSGGTSGGTSFPGSPTNGDRFFRTDRRIAYSYDGTGARWLSDEIFDTGYYNPALAGNQNFPGVSNPFAGTYDIYVSDCVITTNLSAGSTTFTFDLYKFDGTTFSNLGTTSTAGDASTATVKHSIAVNAVVTSAYDGFQMNVARTTGTATLGHGVAIQFRLVG